MSSLASYSRKNASARKTIYQLEKLGGEEFDEFMNRKTTQIFAN